MTCLQSETFSSGVIIFYWVKKCFCKHLSNKIYLPITNLPKLCLVDRSPTKTFHHCQHIANGATIYYTRTLVLTCFRGVSNSPDSVFKMTPRHVGHKRCLSSQKRMSSLEKKIVKHATARARVRHADYTHESVVSTTTDTIWKRVRVVRFVKTFLGRIDCPSYPRAKRNSTVYRSKHVGTRRKLYSNTAVEGPVNFPHPSGSTRPAICRLEPRRRECKLYVWLVLRLKI